MTSYSLKALADKMSKEKVIIVDVVCHWWLKRWICWTAMCQYHSWCVLREVRANHGAHIPRFLCFVWQRVNKVLCLHELGDRQCMSSNSQIVHRSTKVFLRCTLHQASPSLYSCQISQRAFGILIAFGDPETQVDTDSEEIHQNKKSLGSARFHLNLLKVPWSIPDAAWGLNIAFKCWVYILPCWIASLFIVVSMGSIPELTLVVR